MTRRYLAPWIPSLLHVSPQSVMYGVGVVEIAAGILVGIGPHIFGYVVTLWLWGIIVNLLTDSGYYDIALRDFGLSMGALALGRLAWAHRLETAGEVEVVRAAHCSGPGAQSCLMTHHDVNR